MMNAKRYTRNDEVAPHFLVYRFAFIVPIWERFG